MIGHYQYFGYTRENKYGNVRIWSSFIWVDEYGYTQTFLVWGSPKAPIIKRYVHRNRKNFSKKETLSYRIELKRSEYSDYIELKGAEILEKFPNIDSQIGMFMLMRKLKSV